MNTLKKIFILALDGTPYTFLKKILNDGRMPNLKKLMEQSDFRQMDSVIPPVSSAAWASFMTGCGPGKHGIFGFVDRDPHTMEWYVPLSDRIQTDTIQEQLSVLQKKIFMMNVPVTYPPVPVNGILISGFLSSDITGAAYPPEIGALLKARGYTIDADTEIAKKDPDAFYTHLLEVLDRRIETMWHFWPQDDWDFFMTHIMETDRLHHFFWEYMETDHPVWKEKFYHFYERIDSIIGNILDKIPEEMPLMLLSDHGFTTLKKEVYLNRWLLENGYLKFEKNVPDTLRDIDSQSAAYSLYPGRIYINLQGREKNGTILPGLQYEKLRRELKERLLELLDPDDNTQVIQKVYSGEELYESEMDLRTVLKPELLNPAQKVYPDLIAIPFTGYDLKGNLSREKMFEKTVFNGMHTPDDAFILLRNGRLPDIRFSLNQIRPIIYNILGVDKTDQDTDINRVPK